MEKYRFIVPSEKEIEIFVQYNIESSSLSQSRTVMQSILYLLLICLFARGTAAEICLSNIRQVTFPSMGFEKAGESYFSPDGRSIIFQAVPHGAKEYQIYTMDLSIGIPKMVSTGKGACTCGFFRPDGKKIIFASSHESPLNSADEKESSSSYVWDLTPYMNLYEANLDGIDLKPLTTGPAYHAECAYSSDGQKIVYASNETGSMHLYICDADGSHHQRLTHTYSCYHGGPFFSPTGEWIVFRADREEKHQLQIYLIRPDGTEERQLTADAHVNWAPFWHPNGQIIAYTTSKHGHKAYQIYLIDINTGHQYRLTDTNTFEGLPSFSTDGNQITWTSKRGDGTSQVFVADFVLPPEFQ